MEGTTTITVAQACNLMHAHLEAQCHAFMRVYADLPAERRDELARAGSHLWGLVSAAKEDALAQTAEEDVGYQAFKGKLLAKPSRTRRAKTQTA